MICVLFAISQLGATIQPSPQVYVRQKTVVVYGSAYEPAVCVSGTTLYTGSGNTCSAFELPTLTKKWSIDVPGGNQVGTLAPANGIVYLASDPPFRQRNSNLYAIDGRTGRIQWTVPRTGDASPIEVSQGILYLAMEPNSVSAIDTKTHKRLWSHSFPVRRQELSLRDGVDAITASGGYLLVNCGYVTYCLQATSGHELWRQGESYVLSAGLLVNDGVAAVPDGEGMVGRDLRTGTVIWKEPVGGVSDGARTMGHRFVGIGRGKLRAIDARSGKVVWSKNLGPTDTSGGNQYVSVLGNRIYACGISRAGIFDGDGRQLSASTAEQALPKPFWTDGTSLVCFDGLRLLTYREGREAPVARDPESRKRLASELVRRFDTLDQTEIARLKSLGDDAFEPVLSSLRATCAAHDAVGKRGDSFPLYQKYHALAEVLAKITTAKHTGALLDALQKEKKSSYARPILMNLVARVGDPAVVTPYFLEALKDSKTPGFEMYESTSYVARSYIVKSKDPRAVEFMIRQLKDPHGDPTIRTEAYHHLAGSGNPEAVAAVLAERSQRALLRPLDQRAMSGILNAGEFGAKTNVLSEKKDPEGRTWGLLQSGVLGSHGDLWLAEKVAGNWIHPLFCGVSTLPISAWVKPKQPEPKIGGKTGKELAAGAWLDVLIRNEEIRRDTDGDGLTDLVEQRLGTDANTKDTDGDGDADGVDPWPNAAPRPLSDEEKVYAAVFEARFHFDTSEGPALVFSPGKMRPFEMPGRRGPSIWIAEEKRREWSHPLEHRYEQGVAFVNFSPADRGRSDRDVIRWDKDHTEATLTISVYYGGRNGTGYVARVRKIGGKWIVVAMDMAFIS